MLSIELVLLPYNGLVRERVRMRKGVMVLDILIKKETRWATFLTISGLSFDFLFLG
jgi:hypothetical protein